MSEKITKGVISELESLMKTSANQFEQESFNNLAQFGRVQNWDEVLTQIGNSGTDLRINRSDPMGDGDQKKIVNHGHAQVHQNIWSAGADVHELVMRGALPPFIIGCVSGSLGVVTKLLAECDTEEKKRALLETRYSILRLPPIIFAVIGFAMIASASVAKENLAVVKLLLENGARCDARDLCGKNIVHYCAGPLCAPGTTTLLDIASLCIAKGHELSLPPLVDMQDRFGCVPLMQPVMMNRLDLVSFLCKTHKADGSIRDKDGCSPQSISSCNIKISQIITKSRNKASSVAFKTKCSYCNATGIEPSRCVRCKMVTYCGKECQKAHWKVHKTVCNVEAVPESDIIITLGPAAGVIYDIATGNSVNRWTSDVEVNTLFEIKIQVCISNDLFLFVCKVRENSYINISTGYNLINIFRSDWRLMFLFVCTTKREI